MPRLGRASGCSPGGFGGYSSGTRTVFETPLRASLARAKGVRQWRVGRGGGFRPGRGVCGAGGWLGGGGGVVPAGRGLWGVGVVGGGGGWRAGGDIAGGGDGRGAGAGGAGPVRCGGVGSVAGGCASRYLRDAGARLAGVSGAGGGRRCD